MKTTITAHFDRIVPTHQPLEKVREGGGKAFRDGGAIGEGSLNEIPTNKKKLNLIFVKFMKSLLTTEQRRPLPQKGKGNFDKGPVDTRAVTDASCTTH